MTVIIAMALATTSMHSETSAGSRIGGGSLPTDNVDVLGQDDEDDGPDCDWIEEQVRKVGSAYWKTRYYEECVSTIED
jgi:hypothetical protein